MDGLRARRRLRVCSAHARTLAAVGGLALVAVLANMPAALAQARGPAPGPYPAAPAEAYLDAPRRAPPLLPPPPPTVGSTVVPGVAPGVVLGRAGPGAAYPMEPYPTGPYSVGPYSAGPYSDRISLWLMAPTPAAVFQQGPAFSARSVAVSGLPYAEPYSDRIPLWLMAPTPAAVFQQGPAFSPRSVAVSGLSYAEPYSDRMPLWLMAPTPAALFQPGPAFPPQSVAGGGPPFAGPHPAGPYSDRMPRRLAPPNPTRAPFAAPGYPAPPPPPAPFATTAPPAYRAPPPVYPASPPVYPAPPPVYPASPPAYRAPPPGPSSAAPLPSGPLPTLTAAAAPGETGNPAFGFISEIRGGIGLHDAGVFGRREEGGADIDLELLFVSPDFLKFLWSPKPHIGVQVNTQGDTSQLYAGLTWEWWFWRSFFFDFNFGLSVHDGALTTNKLGTKELGSRVLFREAIDLGWNIYGPHSIAFFLAHVSHARLLANENEGMDTIGGRYIYRF